MMVLWCREWKWWVVALLLVLLPSELRECCHVFLRLGAGVVVAGGADCWEWVACWRRRDGGCVCCRWIVLR